MTIERIRANSLFILGVQKAGTTSLHDLLAQHPAIAAANPKEPNHYVKVARAEPMVLASGATAMAALPYFAADDYAAIFGVPSEDTRYFLDSSTGYLPYDEALDAIASQCREPRVIVALRDPVSRAYSAYNWARKMGWEPLTRFEDALAAEERRYAEGYWFSYWYRRHGEYAERIRAVRQRFADVRFVLAEDLAADPQATCSALFDWLGLPDHPVAAVSANKSGSDTTSLRRALRRFATVRREDQGAILKGIRKLVPTALLRRTKRSLVRSLDAKSAPPPALDRDTRESLAAHYRADLAEVETLIGRDLSRWYR